MAALKTILKMRRMMTRKRLWMIDLSTSSCEKLKERLRLRIGHDLSVGIEMKRS